MCRKVHFQPKHPSPSYPTQGPNNRRKIVSQAKTASRLSVPVISLLPKPQTPLKSSGPHGCCGGGGGESVLGGAWGCGSTPSRAEWCGAVPRAVPVRLLSAPARASVPPGPSGLRSGFLQRRRRLLSSRSLWFQGPPRERAHWLGRGPGSANLPRSGREVGAGLQSAHRPSRSCPCAPRRALAGEPRCECGRGPGRGAARLRASSCAPSSSPSRLYLRARSARVPCSESTNYSNEVRGWRRNSTASQALRAAWGRERRCRRRAPGAVLGPLEPGFPTAPGLVLGPQTLSCQA